ncbi:pollen receptor-like kinase 2 [Ricinus communis]|jgi:hypothetical protein|uniref:non-specific serine/threonine protein kinase n=1 Tax=Ricinus communis TaxID=3988 RepID=B9SZF8_RICCO|nr:pollen receptor-like kinase 2 [Ricinus communis]EEF30997.1 leucine-rich repeat transmembrane protein kinase, putative [Ricinus communis]|eukprot:XP_002531377.1 pollen receptor-like kinase 2 [Ricinus communis]
MLDKGRHAAVRAPPCINITSMACKDKPLFLFLSFVVSAHVVVSSALTDSENLLKFKDSLSNASALANWSENIKPCNGDTSNWNGVICVKNYVWGLQLERMGLTGKIDFQILESFPELRTISFMNNSFDGPLPEIKKLGALRSIYLSNNHFSGEIPDNAFEGLLKLKKVFLAHNGFEGAIPSSLANLPKLLDLRLEGNKFSGKLPNFKEKFASLNVSNNELGGPIPESLSKFDLTSFSGNKGLCGWPLSQCDGSNSSSISKKPPLASIVVVAIVVAVAIAAIVGAAFILFTRRKRTSKTIETPPPPPPSNLQKKTGINDVEQGLQAGSSEQSSHDKKTEITKLSFVRDDRERFDLHDLLKASAEILGSGCFGSSYKAALSTGPTMVVKRFKQMNNVGKEEFQEHMRRLGRLRHPNLLPLVAYYYRKEEKLLVTDYVEKGSLAVHLHGHQALGQPNMDWSIRLKVAKGIGKGLVYLHKELPSIIAAHGHLKSSNVLIDECNEPLLTDYGLVPVINQENAQELMVAYRSPEYLQLSRITKKTDVWNLGILILELLTGKFPTNFLPQGKGNEEEDLASWVNSIPEEEWMSKVFDKEIKASKSNESEMKKLLKIGLSCCEGDVEKRLDLREAVERINQVKEKDSDDDLFSSCASEVDTKSSRGISDDFVFS